VGYCLTVWLRDKCGGGYIHRSPGRIVEALVEDFMALAGSGMLTVTVQNTGTITADYSVSKSMHGGYRAFLAGLVVWAPECRDRDSVVCTSLTPGPLGRDNFCP